MAGVSRMGSPDQLFPQQEVIDQPPIPMANAPVAPAEPEDNFDYDAWAQEQIAAQSGLPQEEDNFDYDAWAQEQLAGETTEEQPSILDRVMELPARAKASLQVTDKEIKQSLEGSFGKENVRSKDGLTQYKGNDGKWREWDGGITVEDFTVDMLRPIVEEVPASLATLAAAIPSVAAMISSGGIAIPAGVAATAAARSAGALLGQATADFLQSLTGVPRDEDRSAVLEYGLTAVLAPASGLLADYATKKIAQSAAKSATRKLMKPEDLYKESITETAEALAKVKSLGGMENLPGTDTPLMLYHLNPTNPAARELTEKATHLKGYGQMEEHITQNLEKSSLSFLRTLGNINPENMKSGKEFKGYLDEAFAKENALVDSVRKSFDAEEGLKSALKIPDMTKNVEDFAIRVGFDKTRSSGSKDFAKKWVDTLIDSGYDPAAAKLLVSTTDDVLTKVTNSNGNMKAQELLGMYHRVNGIFRNLSARGHSADSLGKQKIGELRRIIVNQLNTSIGQVSGGNVEKAYVKSLGNLTEMFSAADEFEKLLDKNNLASHSLHKAIFSKGPNALDTAEASKVLLRSRPDLMDDVKGNFLLTTMAKNKKADGRTNWLKFNETVNDPELAPVIKSMFGDEAVEGFKAYETVSRSIEIGNIGAANSADRALFLKNMGAAAFSKLAASNAALEALKQNSGAAALAEIATKEGIDNFVKTAPKDSKPFLKQILSVLQQSALRTAQVAEIPLRRTGKDMSRDKANRQNENP